VVGHEGGKKQGGKKNGSRNPLSNPLKDAHQENVEGAVRGGGGGGWSATKNFKTGGKAGVDSFERNYEKRAQHVLTEGRGTNSGQGGVDKKESGKIQSRSWHR